MAVPAGFNRVYAQVQGALTVDKFWAAVKRGRSFATSGPILTLSLDDAVPGDTLEFESGARFRVAARLRSIYPIDTLELIYNGQVAHRLSLKGRTPIPVLDLTPSWSITPRRSGWVAARALYRAPDGRLRQAHTSPIYLAVDGKPIAFKNDAEYMIRWVDKLLGIAAQPERYRSDADRDQTLEVYNRARQFYQGIAETASKVWGD